MKHYILAVLLLSVTACCSGVYVTDSGKAGYVKKPAHHHHVTKRQIVTTSR